MLVADETGGKLEFGSKEYDEKEVAEEIMDLKRMMEEDKMYNLDSGVNQKTNLHNPIYYTYEDIKNNKAKKKKPPFYRDKGWVSNYNRLLADPSKITTKRSSNNFLTYLSFSSVIEHTTACAGDNQNGNLPA